MNLLNFGSLNIDYVYRVKTFVRPGETIAAESFQRFAGGKGLNQSIALARAGASVKHAGRIGPEGSFLTDALRNEGVDCSGVSVCGIPTGHAVIQVSDSGENCIVLFGGANLEIPEAEIVSALRRMEAGDLLLVQNEISPLETVISAAAARGMRIFFNPAPMTDGVRRFPLHLMDTLIVNETEGAALAECSVHEPYEKILAILHSRYPRQNLLMTRGGEGAVYFSREEDVIPVPAAPVERILDTTGAGDTFLGYFLSGIAAGSPVKETLRRASVAAALCVSRRGAAESIPMSAEVDAAMQKNGMRK